MDLLSRVARDVKSSLGMDEAGSDSSTSTAKQILVFGSSGTGKTSFVNALTGENDATGNGASGVTLKSNEVSISHAGTDYRIIDTVGLNEGEGGGVSGSEAVKSLVQLLKRTEGGLNLLVMVVRHGRILSQTSSNYELFVENMTSKAVPLVVVVTHCERERDMQAWVEENRDNFLTQGIDAKKFLGTTFATPIEGIDNVEAMTRKVRQSVDLSWGAIRAYSTAGRVDFMRMNGGFMKMFRKMYNSVARHFSRVVGGSNAMWVSNDFVNLIQRVGDIPDRAAAVKVAKKISDGRGRRDLIPAREMYASGWVGWLVSPTRVDICWPRICHGS